MYICRILHSMYSICTSKPTVKSSILMLIQNFWDIYIVVYMQSKIRFWNKFAFFAYPATMVTAPEKMAQCSIVACFALRGTYWLVVFPAKERSWKFQRNSRSVRGEPIYPEDASWVWDNVVPREETFRPSQPPPITTDCPFFHFAAETNGWFHKIFEGAFCRISTGTQISPWHACTRWNTLARWWSSPPRSSTAAGTARRSRRPTLRAGPPAASWTRSTSTCSRSPSRGNTFACCQHSPGCGTWKDLSRNLSACMR